MFGKNEFRKEKFPSIVNGVVGNKLNTKGIKMDRDELKEQVLNDEEKSTIELPVAYWKIILGLLEPVCVQRVAIMEKLPLAMIDQLAVKNPEKITELVGPLLARALIFEKLVEDGYVDQEVDDVAGLSWLSRGLKSAYSMDLN
jgi:hypothetical protein